MIVPAIQLPALAEGFVYLIAAACQHIHHGVALHGDDLAATIFAFGLFDLRQGQKVTYVLTGLPKGDDDRSKEIRARITDSTRSVDSAWALSYGAGVASRCLTSTSAMGSAGRWRCRDPFETMK